MKQRTSIMTLIFLTVFFAVSLTNISSAMVGPDFDIEAHRRSIQQAYLISGILILIAYGAVLPVIVFFWKRKYGDVKLKTLFKPNWEEKGTIYGIIAFIIGSIAICSFWWPVVPGVFSFWSVPYAVFLLYFPVPFSIFAVIFCSFNKHYNKFGDLGIKLSGIAFLFSLIFLSASVYLYVT